MSEFRGRIYTKLHITDVKTSVAKDSTNIFCLSVGNQDRSYINLPICKINYLFQLDPHLEVNQQLKPEQSTDRILILRKIPPSLTDRLCSKQRKTLKDIYSSTPWYIKTAISSYIDNLDSVINKISVAYFVHLLENFVHSFLRSVFILRQIC